ncbi:MAG: flagellar hook-basal body complex protein [Algisphaera sp.]
MGLTTSLYTGLTGLAAGSQSISTAGNNIANVNTNAFKSSSVKFETQISQTSRSGSAPGARSGGTNPNQTGLGTRVGSITKNFSNGAISPTGVNTDLALEGDGFFVVNDAGSQRFTRNGNFTVDRDFNLSTASGGLVQGYGVDEDFNVVDGVLKNVKIPMGVTTLASPTTEVKFAGNLNAGGEVGTQGSLTEFETLYSDAAATTLATAGTALDSLYTVDGVKAFALGDVITVSGATRGGATLPDHTFEVNAAATPALKPDAFGTTLGDFATFTESIYGLDTSVPVDPTEPQAGVTVVAGKLSIRGNVGTGNAIGFQGNNLIVNKETAPASPLESTRVEEAVGESTLTTFAAYDSLGNPLQINLVTVLSGKDENGTTWDFYATAEDDTDLNTFLGRGSAAFDREGQFISLSDSVLNLDRLGTGAGNPLAVNLSFIDPEGSVTALTDVGSSLRSLSQDGYPIGTLEDFDFSNDGTLTGTFSNGLRRTLGRIPVATFANNNGLVEVGGSMYRTENNSGDPSITTAGTAGSGTIVSRALELSNVELSDEFVNLITASTGFSAASRIITTSDELIQELLSLVR